MGKRDREREKETERTELINNNTCSSHRNVRKTIERQRGREREREGERDIVGKRDREGERDRTNQ